MCLFKIIFMSSPYLVNGIYPSQISYYPLPTSYYADNGMAIPGNGALTYQVQPNYSAHPTTIAPSYKEVKEGLGSKLDNLSRKEKRKLIKNKRKRMKRQLLSTIEPTVVILRVVSDR